MKKIGIPALILLALMGLGPLYGGYKAEQELNRLVALINAQPGYQASWQSYERKWLNSSAKLQVGSQPLQALLAGDATGHVPLSLTIHHGPVLFSDGVQLGWFSGRSGLSAEPGSLFASLLQQQEMEPFWRTEFKMGLLGTVRFSDRTTPLTINVDGETLQMSGFSGEGSLSLGGQFRYTGELPALNLRGIDAEVQVEGVAFAMDFELSESSLAQHFAPGTFSATVAKVSGAGEGIDDFSLQTLQLVSRNSLSADQQLANMEFQLGFAELSLEENQIEQLKLEFALERISLRFIQQYTDAMAALNDPSSSASAMHLDVLGLVGKELVPAGPRLKLQNFSFQSEKGDLSFTGEAYVPEQQGAIETNLFLLFQALVLQAEFRADKQLVLAMLAQAVQDSLLQTALEQEPPLSLAQVEQAAAEQAAVQLNLLQLQGMLIEQNNSITAQFEFKQGVATLNGKPIPLPF